jgi:cellulose synthase operon protein B
MTPAFHSARRSLIGILACLIMAAPAIAADEKLSPFNMTLKPAPQSEAAGPETQGDEPVSDKTANENVGGNEQLDGSMSESRALVQDDALPASDNSIDRYLVPFDSMVLTGEIDSRTWSVFLTPEQAKSPAQFNIQFTNSVVVLPEESRLRAIINNQQVLETPIDASSRPRVVTFDFPAQALRPGANTIRFEVHQAHRVDCSVEATYELWTRILPAGTGLKFANAEATAIQSLADLPAVGVGADGRTTIHVVDVFDPGPAGQENYLDAVQQIALLGQFPHPVVEVSDLPLKIEERSGHLALVVATVDRIAETLGFRPDGADERPVFGIVSGSDTYIPVVVASGPTVEAVREALEAVRGSPGGGFASVDSIHTGTWSTPDAPLFSEGRTVTFAELGVPTQQFAGRRFQTQFAVGLTPDFYADAYGEALLYLDAAFSRDVEPQSRIDVYVNDRISSTLQLRTRGGALMSDQPIRIPLKNFTPGINFVRLEAILETEADRTCLPGTTLVRQPRFALFDSTELHIPDYAKITRRPDLGSFAAGALPYAQDEDPTFIHLLDHDPLSLSAAGTIVTKLALARGRPLPLTVAGTEAALAGNAAIIIQPSDSIAPGILARLGVSEPIELAWGNTAAPLFTGSIPTSDDTAVIPGLALRGTVTNTLGDDDDDLRSQWREKVSGNILQNLVYGIRNWFLTNSGITSDLLGFGDAQPELTLSSVDTGLLIAQGTSLDNNKAWTIVTGPTAEDLVAGVNAISAPLMWRQVSGRVAEWNRNTIIVENFAASSFAFVPTRPLTFSNLHRIAANWFSNNIIVYALSFIGMCVLLGIATTLMVQRTGRDK